MSASFRGSSRATNDDPRKTRRFSDEYEEEGSEEEGESEPLETIADIPAQGKLFIGIIESGWGGFTNILQVTTSAIACISLIIGGADIAIQSVPEIAHKFPMIALIGLAIAGSIQVVLHMNAQPIRATVSHLRHIQNFNFKDKATWKDVQNAITFRSLLFLIAIAGDIVSDSTFVNLYTHNALIILFWIVFMTGSSTIVMYDGWARVWQAFEDWKDYRRFHREYDEA